MPASEKLLPTSDRYLIAVITLADEVFGDMRRALSTSFRLTQASTENQIKDLIDNPRIHGIVLDLETIGGGPAEAIEVLQEIRRLRDDVMLVAITESTASELPLLASQAGADGRPSLRKLSRAEIVRLKQERAQRHSPFRVMARRFGVSVWTAHRLCAGRD